MKPPAKNPVIENLFKDFPTAGDEEHFHSLFERPGLRLERIISWGHATPPGEWYDQEQDEWVMVVRGAARLRVERATDPAGDDPGTTEDVHELAEGDMILLPAHCRHRVEWTTSERPTIWLALHVWANPDDQD